MTVQRIQNVRPRPGDFEDDLGSGSEVSDHVESGFSDNEEGNSPTPSGGDRSDEADVQGENFERRLNNISFGALKEAQDQVSRKRKRGSESTADQEGKLEALRDRLKQIKEAKARSTAKSASAANSSHKRKSEKQGSVSDEETSANSDSDSGPSEEDAPPKSRTSKHAPAAQSSKRQVTRKRTVIDVPKQLSRDPRFDAIAQRSSHPGNSEKAYSFLQEYQKSEIQELKTAVQRTRDEEDKEVLKRRIGSMENRLKAREAKERQQEVVRRHRREERERVEQGKTPYYLKRKEIREQTLVEKFRGMKSKEREKLVERRRKKEGQKEKKRMPDARRVVG